MAQGNCIIKISSKMITGMAMGLLCPIPTNSKQWG